MEETLARTSLAVVLAVLVGSPAFGQVDRFPELVGRWVNLEEGQEIRIERDGAVFAKSSDFPLAGSAGRCAIGGANFCFAGSLEVAYPVVPGAPKYGILMGRREGRGKWTLNGQSALAYRIPTGISR